MMEVDSEPRCIEGKLDDGQFALDCEVKFARSSLNVSHDLEMECCTYFAQLRDKVVHAVTTPITETALATGNANTCTVEAGVMNAAVVVIEAFVCIKAELMITCVEWDATLEEFNGNFAPPIG